jgi:hypothetical protein
MAISTYGVYLMKGTGTGTITYSKLVDIKSFPDLGGGSDALDTTTLSDGFRHYIPGIKDPAGGGGLQFTANYTKSDFTALEALEDTETDFAIYIGHDSSNAPDGHDGKFSFKGLLSVGIAGGNVNEVANMNITIFPTTDIEFE